MLAIIIERPDGRTAELFDIPRIVIGSADGCDLVLVGDGIAAQHARLEVAQLEVVLVSLAPEPTYLAGKRLLSAGFVEAQAEIRIGEYTLHPHPIVGVIEDPPPIEIRGAEEHALIDAIEAGDRASRLVYADWLEQRGDLSRAEYLRMQYGLFNARDDDPTVTVRGDRLRELAAIIGNRAWRSRVAMLRVEGCAFEVSCPRDWAAMTPTDGESVRHCGTCRRNVMYCGSVEVARAFSAMGMCVALDIQAPPWPRDLAPPPDLFPCDDCKVDVGSRLAECPRCGPLLRRRSMVLGRVA